MEPTACGKKQAQVSEQMAMLEESIDGISNSVGNLEGRLEQILTNPTPTEEVAKEQNELVPLANSLCSFRAKIKSIDKRVTNIMGRLEL